MDPLTQLAEHLKFLTDLGVDGVSRDAAWRKTDVGPTPPPVTATAAVGAASVPV